MILEPAVRAGLEALKASNGHCNDTGCSYMYTCMWFSGGYCCTCTVYMLCIGDCMSHDMVCIGDCMSHDMVCGYIHRQLRGTVVCLCSIPACRQPRPQASLRTDLTPNCWALTRKRSEFNFHFKYLLHVSCISMYMYMYMYMYLVLVCTSTCTCMCTCVHACAVEVTMF